MKKGLLLLFMALILNLSLMAQQKGSEEAMASLPSDELRMSTHANVTIYPVPVKENNFTIKSDKDISYIKITNIIGQDILRVKYNNPQQQIRVFLDNQKRGMYLVTILFSDGSRIVKKIMVEESE